MKNKKIFLITSISLEILITAATIIQQNYIAAVGWGFLMLTNIGILMDLIEKEKKDGNSN